MHSVIEPILNHHLAPQLLEQLQLALADESQRRHVFREWVDETQKAEFINGEPVLHSPVKKRHLDASRLLSGLLSYYVMFKKTGVVWTEKAMIALTRNDYEPDICFFSKEKAETFTEDQMLFPAPDFVVEILSKRTAKNDRTIKKQDYAAHGVREYWIIDPNRQTIEQYFLINPTDTEYFQPYSYTIAEDIESRVIEGFNIPVAAIFNETANVEALQTLLR